MKTSTITLTLGENSENHVGMKKQGLGKLADKGFDIKDLKKIKKNFEDVDCKCKLIKLNDALDDEESDSDDEVEDAYLLIIRKGVDALINETKYKGKEADDVFNEHVILNWDKKYFDTRRQKVLNKHARYNLCYSNESVEPDYKNKQGRVISYDNIPITKAILKKFKEFFGDKAENLEMEGNYYYDIKKCYIAGHGDSERKIVIAMRLGASINLHYQWYYKTKKIGKQLTYQLHNGDIYVMSEKATGYDWKKELFILYVMELIVINI